MVYIISLLTNGHGFMFSKSEDNNDVYFLPVANSPTLLGAKRKMKKQFESLKVSFCWDEQLCVENVGEDCFILYKCIATEYSSFPQKSSYQWIDCSECFEIKLNTQSSKVSIFVKNYINRHLELIQQVKKCIAQSFKQQDVELQFSELFDSLGIFIKSADSYCIFSFWIHFTFIEEKEVEFDIIWNVNRSFAPGDKSDIYILF